MERKIGDTFEFEGKKLQVKESASNGCDGCFFYMKCSSITMGLSGECEVDARDDGKDVIFVEVQEQPQQAEQPKKLNLCEILKNCPKRTEFWSDDYGIVRFDSIFIGADTPIRVTRPDEYYSHYTKEGWHCKEMPGSCLLWPSRDCRDWSKFTAPWLKKERFDPKTLKAFDKVLVRFDCGVWSATLFSHLIDSKFANKKYDIICCGSVFGYCIPYNDETKHLVGTKDEAPDFYKYWED